MTRVSAIVPARNAAATLARAVGSLIDTNYPGLDVIVVDDGSEDATREIATDLCRQYPSVVSLVSHAGGQSRGVSASRNLGVMRSAGDLVCFLDADDFVYPYRFATSAPLLEQSPSVDAVYGYARMVFADEAAQRDWMDPAPLFGLSEDLTGDCLLQALIKGRTWHTGAILCRRSLLRRTGLFNERMAFAEDCHLWIRMACVGRVIADGTPEPISAYVRHGANTYHYGPERRLDMVRAVSSLYTWARFRHLSETTREVLSRGIRDYAHQSVVALREARRPDLARRVLMTMMMTGAPAMLFDKRLLRQWASLCAGAIGGSNGSGVRGR